MPQVGRHGVVNYLRPGASRLRCPRGTSGQHDASHILSRPGLPDFKGDHLLPPFPQFLDGHIPDAFASPEQLAIPDLIGAKPGSISALGGRRSRWFRTRLSLVRLLRALTACLIPGQRRCHRSARRRSLGQASPSVPGGWLVGIAKALALSPVPPSRRVIRCKALSCVALLAPNGCRLSTDLLHLTNGEKVQAAHSRCHRRQQKNLERCRRSPMPIPRWRRGLVF